MNYPDDLEILAATAEGLGTELESWQLVQEGVSGDGVVRAYETVLRRTGAATQAEEEPVTQVFYLETADTPRTQVTEQDGVLVFRNEETGDEVSVWLYPKDPALPALPTVVYPQAAAVILSKMGINPSGLNLHLVAYRPGRRAVVRMQTDRGTIFMKVVRPHQIIDLHERYRLWAGAGVPVPRTLGWNEDGLIGFESLNGVPAHEMIEHLGDAFLDSVEALIDRYGHIDSTGAARTSLAERRDWYVRRLTRQHPELEGRLVVLEGEIARRLRDTGRAEKRTVHSDLHLGQIFVHPDQPDTITGVLDIDTAGVGDPADDAAALYAHLLVSADFAVERQHGSQAHFERLAAAWRERWEVRGGAFVARAHAIAATHLIAHGLGGLVPAERLIARTEQLLGLR